LSLNSTTNFTYHITITQEFDYTWNIPTTIRHQNNAIYEELRFMADGGIWKDHNAECMTTVEKDFQGLISGSAALQKLLGISFPKMDKVFRP
jgi:hypothetical protein